MEDDDDDNVMRVGAYQNIVELWRQYCLQWDVCSLDVLTQCVNVENIREYVGDFVAHFHCQLILYGVKVQPPTKEDRLLAHDKFEEDCAVLIMEDFRPILEYTLKNLLDSIHYLQENHSTAPYSPSLAKYCRLLELRFSMLALGAYKGSLMNVLKERIELKRFTDEHRLQEDGQSRSTFQFWNTNFGDLISKDNKHDSDVITVEQVNSRVYPTEKERQGALRAAENNDTLFCMRPKCRKKNVVFFVDFYREVLFAHQIHMRTEDNNDAFGENLWRKTSGWLVRLFQEAGENASVLRTEFRGGVFRATLPIAAVTQTVLEHQTIIADDFNKVWNEFYGASMWVRTFNALNDASFENIVGDAEYPNNIHKSVILCMCAKKLVQERFNIEWMGVFYFKRKHIIEQISFLWDAMNGGTLEICIMEIFGAYYLHREGIFYRFVCPFECFSAFLYFTESTHESHPLRNMARVIFG